MRHAITAILTLRVAYGVALVVRPQAITRRWLGDAVRGAPTQTALRGLGARDALIHAAALATRSAGGSARPWLYVSIGGDLGDIAATVAARRGLPRGAAAATAAVAGGSAMLSAVAATKA